MCRKLNKISIIWINTGGIPIVPVGIVNFYFASLRLSQSGKAYLQSKEL